MDYALTLSQVDKRYGQRKALSGLTFQIPRGSISGLIGPNGAGKTTCFGIIGGLLKADGGSIDVLGQGPYDPERQRGLLGLLPQDSEIIPHGRVAIQLTYLARLQGLSAKQAAMDVTRVLELVALRDRESARISELSHGMRRRVAVAQALLGTPKLVLLDEPTSGLDPHLVKHMRDVIVDTRRKHGTTFVVSSHVLADLEAICDHAVFMEAGRAMREGPLGELTGKDARIRVRLAREPSSDALNDLLRGLDYRFRNQTLEVHIPEGQDLERTNTRILQALLSLDVGVLELRSGSSLEQTYLEQRKGWNLSKS